MVADGPYVHPTPRRERSYHVERLGHSGEQEGSKNSSELGPKKPQD